MAGTAGTTGNTGSTGNTGTSSLELNAADGGTYTIPQGGTYLFRATDSEGDTVSYEIDNNPTGVGIDSNTGLVTVASSVATGTHTITVMATSTNADGSVDTDVETYNIEVTSNGSTSPTNTVDADFDSTGAGFSTLNGQNITDSSLATNDDDEFEVPNATDLANSYVIDGWAGAATPKFEAESPGAAAPAAPLALHGAANATRSTPLYSATRALPMPTSLPRLLPRLSALRRGAGRRQAH